MNNLNLLIIEGNTNEENYHFKAAGCIPQSDNFKQHVKKIEPNTKVDIVKPTDELSISKIIPTLKSYDGIILTGSTLRILDNNNTIKKHILFAKKCFESEQKIFAACWGLQITVTAAGGKCRISPNDPHIGIAHDIKLTNEGKSHDMYIKKSHTFTAPAFNHDEVEKPPKDSILLASDKINKFMALQFSVGKSEVWGLQYHPEIPYGYMIKLIKHRSKALLSKKIFKHEDDLNKHIQVIEKARSILKYEERTLELKNWLTFIKKNKR